MSTITKSLTAAIKASVIVATMAGTSNLAPLVKDSAAKAGQILNVTQASQGWIGLCLELGFIILAWWGTVRITYHKEA